MNRQSYDIQKRKERMTNYYTGQEHQDFSKPEKPLQVINPKQAPQQMEKPLIEQVKFYFQNRIKRLEFTQLFEGPESFNQMMLVILSTTFEIGVIGLTAIWLNYVGKIFVLLLCLINGFHILGMNIFYISKNSDRTLTALIVILCVQFLLFNQLWGGGLQTNIFSLAYVLFNGYRFVRQLPISAPNSQLHNSKFDYLIHGFLKSLELQMILIRFLNFLFFLIPTYGLVLLIDFYYQQQRVNFQKIILACLLDMILQQSEGILIIFKKYYVFNLSKEIDQLPLFIYALSLQNSPQQEIEALNYINQIDKDQRFDRVFDKKLHFRLDGCIPPTINDIVQSYFNEKLQKFIEEITNNFNTIKKLQMKSEKVRKLIDDITLPLTLLFNFIQIKLIKRRQLQLIKMYYYVFKSFDKFQREQSYEVDCLRYNIQLLMVIQTNKYEEQKINDILKSIARISEQYIQHEIFQQY